jgi:type IV secretion system protein VirD4
MGPSGFRVISVLLLALGALVVVIGMMARDNALVLAGMSCVVIPMVVRLFIAILGPFFNGRPASQTTAGTGVAPVAPSEPDQDEPQGHWATEDGLEQAGVMAADPQIYLARWRNTTKLIGLPSVRRLMTFCNQSTDFYQSSVIPNALTSRDNLLVFEANGLVCKAVRDRRAQLGQKMIVLDPFGRSGSTPDQFNPFDFMRPQGDGLVSDAGMLAELLLAPHFIRELDPQDARVARVLLQGLIIHTCRNASEANRHLAEMRRSLTLPSHRFYPLLGELMDIDATEGRISDIALSIMDMSDEHRSAIIDACRRATAVFEISQIEYASSKTSFELEDISLRDASVFIIGDPPEGDDQSLIAWSRVVLGCFLSLISRRDLAQKIPSFLVMLDGVEKLGRLVQLERLLGGGGGSSNEGLTLWPCFSGVSAVMDVCHNWENVVGRSDVLQIFGQDGAFDLDWTAGLTAMSRFVDTSNRSGTLDAPVHLRSRDKQPMLKSVEVARLPDIEQLLFCKGLPPIRALRLQWADDDAFRLLATRPPTF